MPSTVEYCLSSCGAESLRNVESSDIDIRERRCLEHCGVCRDRAFAVVDGRVVDGSTLSTVLDTVTDTECERE
jgi:uncharacterized protein YuzB (UPF0349 family)